MYRTTKLRAFSEYHMACRQRACRCDHQSASPALLRGFWLRIHVTCAGARAFGFIYERAEPARSNAVEAFCEVLRVVARMSFAPEP